MRPTHLITATDLAGPTTAATIFRAGLRKLRKKERIREKNHLGNRDHRCAPHRDNPSRSQRRETLRENHRGRGGLPGCRLFRALSEITSSDQAIPGQLEQPKPSHLHRQCSRFSMYRRSWRNTGCLLVLAETHFRDQQIRRPPSCGMEEPTPKAPQVRSCTYREKTDATQIQDLDCRLCEPCPVPETTLTPITQVQNLLDHRGRPLLGKLQGDTHPWSMERPLPHCREIFPSEPVLRGG